MATISNPNQCAICKKDNVTARCFGCLQDFCFKHFVEHRQQLNRQLDQIEQDRDLFQQTLNQQTANPLKNSLIQQVDEWEKESIEKIKQTAQEIRQTLLVHVNEDIISAKDKVNQLTEQLKHSREEDNVTENCLSKWRKDLEELTEQMNKPSNIFIQQTRIALVNKIQVEFSGPLSIPIISDKAKWAQNGTTVAGGNGPGNAVNQLHLPYSLFIDDDQNIYVTDHKNHRIVLWKKNARVGQVIAGGNGQGNRDDQLSNPRNVLVDKQNESLIICDTDNRRVVRWPCQQNSTGETIISNIGCSGVAKDRYGYLYISDIAKHEVRRWKIGEKDGTLVAGGNGAGNRLDQLNTPEHILVDQYQSIYVSDYGNHRVIKWAKGAREGIVVAGGQGQGSAPNQLNNPGGIVVDQSGTVYVADYRNNRVVRWLKGATEGSMIVGTTSSSWDLSFDQQNNLYMVEWNNARVQKFNIESE